MEAAAWYKLTITLHARPKMTRGLYCVDWICRTWTAGRCHSGHTWSCRLQWRPVCRLSCAQPQ